MYLSVSVSNPNCFPTMMPGYNFESPIISVCKYKYNNCILNLLIWSRKLQIKR